MESIQLFIKESLENKEPVILILDENRKSDIMDKIEQLKKDINISELVDQNFITILSSSERYFLDDHFGISNFKNDFNDMLIQLSRVLEENLGRIRVYCKLSAFQINKIMYNLNKFEEYPNSNSKYDIQVLYVLDNEDLSTLNKIQLSWLFKSYQLRGKSINFDPLINPLLESHIILLYDSISDLNTALSRYVNEGLKRDEICIFASVNKSNDFFMKNFQSKIINFDENVVKGNFIIYDLAPYYVHALNENLDRFDELLKDCINRAHKSNSKDNNDKNIRLIVDCAPLLLKNRHFHESIKLEQWWDSKRIKGSCLCPYPKEVFASIPNKYCFSDIIDRHDIAVDCKGNVILEHHLQ